MKKIIISWFLLLIVGGCWNYKELNDYAIATSMAIDYVDNEYMVSFLISNGKKSDDGKKFQPILYSGRGKSIYEAIKNVDLISMKQLYIGHLGSVVISDKVAYGGIYDALEFLLEDSGSKKNFYVFLAKDCKAMDVLSITTPISNNEAILMSSNDSYKLQGSVVDKTFSDVIYELINDGIDTFISSYVVVGDINEGSSMDNLESTTPNTYIKLDDLGIFKGDKLVAWADKNISKGINIINNSANEIYVNIDCDDGYIIVNTNDLKTSKEISKDRIKINTKGHASISEVTCNIDLRNKDNIDKIEKDINNKIKELIKNGYDFVRENGSDIFGLGLEYYRNNPNEYKNIDFNYIYSNINPEIVVDIDIKNSGNIKQSLRRIGNED